MYLSNYIYANVCIKNNKKTIVEFGIKLTEKQKNKIKKELELVMKETYKWEVDRDNKKLYAYKLYDATKCKFYKENVNTAKS